MNPVNPIILAILIQTFLSKESCKSSHPVNPNSDIPQLSTSPNKGFLSFGFRYKMKQGLK